LAKSKSGNSGSSGERQGFKLGRDSRDGRFVTLADARRRPATTQIEVVPLPGRGDTGRSKGK
jgi:hypothetical protein